MVTTRAGEGPQLREGAPAAGSQSQHLVGGGAARGSVELPPGLCCAPPAPHLQLRRTAR